MAGESVELEGLLKQETLAAQVVTLWDQWNTARTFWKTKVSRVAQYIFAESTRDTEGGGHFDHSTHRPKIAQIYDNLVANYTSGLMPHKRWLKIEAEGADALTDKKKRKAVLGYLITKHRISKFQAAIEDLIDDWVLYGNAFALVYYTSENTNTENSNAQQGTNYSGPVVRRVSPYDIVFNPAASSWDRTPKIIRSIKSIGELMRESQDNPADGWKIEALNELRVRRLSYHGISPEDINKSTQMKIDGFGTWADYVQSDNVEVLELYGDVYDPMSGEFYRDHVVTVVDRSIVVRNMALSTWTGRPHIHHVGWRKRKDNLWAMGPLENLTGLQYRINHLENARADAFDDMIYGDLVVSGNVQVEDNPDGSRTYILPDSGTVSRLAPDTTILNADFQLQEIEQKMELYAGSPREASGQRTPGEKTKFEVNLLAIAAGRIFQHKMTKFEVNLLEPIVNSEIQLAREYMQRSEEVRYDDKGNGLSEFLKVNKKDLMLNGTITPIGARHFARNTQLVQELNIFNSQILPADRELAQHFSSWKLAQVWEEVLGFDQFELAEKNVRIAEGVEAQRLVQSGTTQLQVEATAGAPAELGEEGVIG